VRAPVLETPKVMLSKALELASISIGAAFWETVTPLPYGLRGKGEMCFYQENFY